MKKRRSLKVEFLNHYGNGFHSYYSSDENAIKSIQSRLRDFNDGYYDDLEKIIVSILVNDEYKKFEILNVNSMKQGFLMNKGISLFHKSILKQI